ncbi:TetR/AcrR family transcriptional regulator [Ornithinimicrobium faecis]|uniref:TetR/AcrR family transcriptional regulator n=1 Tax=Ornithinimicrobium faecis TaxID=2934158 RepID=UPI002118A788|nr:TetR/AcrR family transcriptional regulator [Ornithinimicrobium sp. HY1745]
MTNDAPAPDRRTALADASIDIVAEHGLRGLTHRAVDGAAGVPVGSTSNIFRSRAALIEALAERIEARELSVAASALTPTEDLGELLARVARFAVDLVVHHEDLVRVRFTLFVAWPERFVPGHRRFRAAAQQGLAAAGVVDSERAAERVVDHLDGVMLHAVTVRGGQAPGVDELTDALRRLVG